MIIWLLFVYYLRYHDYILNMDKVKGFLFFNKKTSLSDVNNSELMRHIL